jgi:hypothetical protein
MDAIHKLYKTKVAEDIYEKRSWDIGLFSGNI